MAGYLAIYLRLSQDDMDLKTNALKDESNSIHSQRLLIHGYIKEHAELDAMPVQEFVDDGYTGTHFDRPQLQKMLAQVRRGDIACILVKDLSRFGRNYLEVGDYLEHIFPFLKVRFIAVNDHYDSQSYLGTTGGIDVAFRNLIYQRYSQDLSEKVKSAMHTKMAQGRYVTNCPYGYQKEPGEKHKMIPDPHTAPIVQEIFRSAISGMKSTEIAAMLNARNVPTPMVYKHLTRKNIQNDAMWSHQAIIRIIREYKYTGAMVNFRCENETIRAKAQRKCRPEEWVVTPDSHEAIVTQEEYEAANASLRKVRGKNSEQSKHFEHSSSFEQSKATEWPKDVGRPKDIERPRDFGRSRRFERLKRRDRVYYCAYCGRRLRKTFGLDEYYSCATRLYRRDSPCVEVRWARTEIESVVLAAYKGQLALLNEAYQKKKETPAEAPLKVCREMQKSLSRELAACDSQSLRYYEQYRSGIFDKEVFLEKKAALQQRKEQLKDFLAELRKKEDEALKEQEEAATRQQMMKESEELLERTDEELKEQMYDQIERVTVYAGKELDIRWKFDVDFGAEEAG